LFGPYKTYQVAVSQIEALTGLSLGDLSARDPLVSALEAMSLHEINGAADIVL
jgi:DNA/RNA endonuclease G (NUC1)